MRAHAVRLRPGADLRAELERLARELPLAAGCVLTCVGSLARARLRMPGAAGEAERFRAFEGPLEIVSLTGTLGPDGPHLHISLANRDGVCVGGHLVLGCVVHTTAEVVIGDLGDVAFARAPDAETGYAELTVSPRRPS